jgi:hypothetical protein
MTTKHIRIGPDIDLDAEEIFLNDGTRLTEALAAEIAAEAVAKHPARRGRPSITGGAAHTPKMTVRVAPETRRALEVIAAKEGRRLTDVSRDALAEYVARRLPAVDSE